MTQTSDPTDPQQTPQSPARGQDDRRSEVNPAQNPAPSSPEADPEVVRQAEETLERVKPY